MVSSHFWEVDLKERVYNFTVELKWDSFDDLDLYLFEAESDIKNYDKAIAFSLSRLTYE